MAQFNFDQFINREDTACVKYDLRKVIFGNANVIPMWVADMDIPTPEFILNAVKTRCNHPFLGYTFRDDTYNSAIVNWYARRHGWKIQPSWLEFCPGVVSGLNHVIRAFTKPGDRIIIQPPVYHPFFSTVENNGRTLVHNSLIEINGDYTINFEELELIASEGASMLIFSSPHNPVGRVWTKDELFRVGEICLKYNVLAVSDEIHSDLVYTSFKHIPFASINSEIAQKTITFGSASKTFNIAGLSSGFAIIPNPELMQIYKNELEASGAGMGNIFGYEAVKAAFTNRGEEWLNELLNYLTENINLVEKTLKEHLPKVKMVRPHGTYLLWLDFRALGLDETSLNSKLINDAGLGLNAGAGFGKEGEGFQRMNIACPHQTVQLAMDRMIKTFKVN